MSSLADIYTSAVYGNLKPLYGNWFPDTPIKLGDYGTLNNNQFIPLGNIGDPSIGITFKVTSSPSSDQINFSSSGTTKVTLTAAGTANVSGGVSVKASLEVDFSSQESVFFNAAGCSYNMIEDKVTLGASIMNLFNNGTWNRDWAVVTDLVATGSTTIAVSGGQSSSVVFQASGNVPQIDLADASIGLSVVSSSNVALQIAAEKGLNPLIGLSKIQDTFLWWGNQFGPTMLFSNLKLLSKLQDTRQFNSKSLSVASIKNNPIYFGQLN
jgi:hypothetical protein